MLKKNSHLKVSKSILRILHRLTFSLIKIKGNKTVHINQFKVSSPFSSFKVDIKQETANCGRNQISILCGFIFLQKKNNQLKPCLLSLQCTRKAPASQLQPPDTDTPICGRHTQSCSQGLTTPPPLFTTTGYDKTC